MHACAIMHGLNLDWVTFVAFDPRARPIIAAGACMHALAIFMMMHATCVANCCSWCMHACMHGLNLDWVMFVACHVAIQGPLLQLVDACMHECAS